MAASLRRMGPDKHGKDGAPSTDHEGRAIDFGRTADDYDRYRPGFPRSMFDRLDRMGILRRGARTLDLGTGTGAMALGLSERGLSVVGLDRAPELLAIARRRTKERGLDATFVEGVVEDLPFADGSFDLVAAGQCWWWFDPTKRTAEVRRVLERGGRILLASFCYLPFDENVAEQSERILLGYNPGWRAAACTGLFPEQVIELVSAGFRSVESFSYDEDVGFTHEAWRGRMRACNGAGASLTPEVLRAYDADLAGMLARDHAEPLSIPHRIYIVTGVR